MKVLVTGGGGFLGTAVVKELLARGHEPTSLSRSSYAHLDELGVPCVEADLGRDVETLERALAGHDAVIHTAAKAGVWGAPRDYEVANVLGTRHLVEAALKSGVRRFVHTSSPSVCFDGKDHRNAKNDLPYAERFLAPYPRTKADAERLVLRSNRPGGALATCALRPHLIVGPGDPHLVPRLVAKGRAGRLAIVGPGDNEVSLTHVDNAAAAHVDALEALDSTDAPHAGRAYFLGQEEPVQLWEWIGELFDALDIPRVTRRVPFRLAYAAGGALELVWNVLPLPGEPPMTRFVAAQLATSHSYDLAPAREDFGYRERVSLEEATASVVASARQASSA